MYTAGTHKSPLPMAHLMNIHKCSKSYILTLEVHTTKDELTNTAVPVKMAHGELSHLDQQFTELYFF